MIRLFASRRPRRRRRPVPSLVLDDLLDAFTRHTSEYVLTQIDDAIPGERLFLDTRIGRVVAWVWRTDPPRAVEILREVELRTQPACGYDDLVRAVRDALPDGDYDDLWQAMQDMPAATPP